MAMKEHTYDGKVSGPQDAGKNGDQGKAKGGNGHHPGNSWNANEGPHHAPDDIKHPIDQRPTDAQGPTSFTGLKLEAPAGYAAGLPGVLRSLKHLGMDHSAVRGSRALTVLNQKDGIDCMSCAWPEPDGERRMAEFCESGAKAVAWETDSRRATPEFFRDNPVSELALRSDFWLGQQGRIERPMVLREGAPCYEPITWDEAFKLIADELNLMEKPDEAIFYTSGRTSNEGAFVYQLFARQFGTNNLPDCSNMCHESSGSALTEVIGIGKGTVTLEDFLHTDLILILGQNPGTNHPRMLTTLQNAKENGAKIIAINPLYEAGLLRFKDPQEFKGIFADGIEIADMYLQVKINGDMALLKGIMKELLAMEEAAPKTIVDWQFIKEKCAGWDEFVAALEREEFGPLIAQSGITREQMREAAEMIAASDRVIACWAMGLTQHKNAVATIQEIVNLLLMRGSIGREGAGVAPIRGHSNVQGDRTMGIWERPKDEFLDKLRDELGFEPPRRHGYDAVESIKAMHTGKIKVFFALGGNFLSATPDTEYTAEALRNTHLTVHVSTKLNRSHLVTGRSALILPCLGRTEVDKTSVGEQFVTTENSMGVIEMSRGRLEPASEYLLSEQAIICKLAKATLGERTNIDWEGLANDYDKIREMIARCVKGCEDYNAKVRKPGGFYLPNKPREANFEHAKDGKANFTAHKLPDHSLREGELVMMTVRSHDQFNTTIYGLDDHYRGVNNERRVIFMNVADMDERGLTAGDVVDLTSEYDGFVRTAKHFIVVPYQVPKINCATYFPETNNLVPVSEVAEKSNTPVSKFVKIRVKKTSEPGVRVSADWIQ